MRDPMLGPESKAAFLQAIQRLSLAQSAEESVNVNAESEDAARNTCPACGTSNRKENNFCASCGATLLKSPRQAEAVVPNVTPAPEHPGDHHYHHHYHHHYFSHGDGMELGAGSDMRSGGGTAGIASACARRLADLR